MYLSMHFNLHEPCGLCSNEKPVIYIKVDRDYKQVSVLDLEVVHQAIANVVSFKWEEVLIPVARNGSVAFRISTFCQLQAEWCSQRHSSNYEYWICPCRAWETDTEVVFAQDENGSLKPQDMSQVDGDCHDVFVPTYIGGNRSLKQVDVTVYREQLEVFGCCCHVVHFVQGPIKQLYNILDECHKVFRCGLMQPMQRLDWTGYLACLQAEDRFNDLVIKALTTEKEKCAITRRIQRCMSHRCGMDDEWNDINTALEVYMDYQECLQDFIRVWSKVYESEGTAEDNYRWKLSMAEATSANDGVWKWNCGGYTSHTMWQRHSRRLDTMLYGILGSHYYGKSDVSSKVAENIDVVRMKVENFGRVMNIWTTARQ